MREEKKFEISDYDPLCLTKFVLRHFWMVVLFALTCIMGVYLLQTVSDKPVYTSTVTFAVTSRSSASTAVVNIAATDTVAGQFGGLLESELVRNAAARNMGLSRFPASVSIQVPENTNILIMSITADTPELAYKSALAIIDCHTEYSTTVFAQAVIDSINGPTIPTEPANLASRNSMLRISGPIGAAAMIALLLFLAIRNDTVQTITGAKHQIDGKLLATIYHENNRLTFKEKLKKVKKSILISDPPVASTIQRPYTRSVSRWNGQRRPNSRASSLLPVAVRTKASPPLRRTWLSPLHRSTARFCSWTPIPVSLHST